MYKINCRNINIFSFAISTILIFCSCGAKDDCTIADHLSGQWAKIDSTEWSYQFCHNSGTLVEKDDIIELEYLGSSAPGKKEVEFDSREQQLLMLFGIVPIGKYKPGDKALDIGLKPLFGRLKKNAVAIARLTTWNETEISIKRKLTFYFNNETSEDKISSLLNDMKKKYAFIDSTNYISREAAMAVYDKENDTSWKKILDANPFPVSADIYINRQASDSLPPEKLSDLFANETVSEIVDNNSIEAEELQMFEKLQRTYYIKIKTGR